MSNTLPRNSIQRTKRFILVLFLGSGFVAITLRLPLHFCPERQYTHYVFLILLISPLSIH